MMMSKRWYLEEEGQVLHGHLVALVIYVEDQCLVGWYPRQVLPLVGLAFVQVLVVVVMAAMAGRREVPPRGDAGRLQAPPRHQHPAHEDGTQQRQHGQKGQPRPCCHHPNHQGVRSVWNVWCVDGCGAVDGCDWLCVVRNGRHHGRFSLPLWFRPKPSPLRAWDQAPTGGPPRRRGKRAHGPPIPTHAHNLV